MKKTLSLLLALVMVIGLFPGFADEKATLTAEEAGAVLQGYGAIKGGSDGNLMIDKELKRQDAVVILTRLMGKEADALATQAAPSFEDITIDYYKPFLAFAEANKWVEGKAEKKFGFNDVVTVKEFTAMLLRALGHDTMGDNYAKVMDLAKEQGLFQGVMAEEAAPVIRGVAFIMMNNTLETAPKGEKEALVYKLGYKEMPKPENLTVISAEAAGLKAIDVKFSKDVNEESLSKIAIKDGSKKIGFKGMLLDSMTARLVLTQVAKQDAKYSIIVDGVKAVDMKEAVEKFEGTVYMTDATRPEVLAAEALNPKTILVKTSEPVANASNVVKKLNEVKIDGKALYGKIMNENKNEIVVELNKALKPGDYKVEISGLKDYANFIAKTMEFDITVVEDKDAPVVTEAKMVNVEAVKVVFNEGIYEKGTFKVNGEKANIDSEFKKGDKEITLNLTKALDIGAVVEVKVEYKGQKDIMGNTVKDATTFTFKVEDDATLPEVKEATVSGSTVSIEFTKNMLKKAPAGGSAYTPVYSLIKDGKTIIKKAAIKDSYFNKDGNVLKLTISQLDSSSALDYTLVLEGLKDATVRMNAMPKTEVPFAGKDTQKPTVSATYKEENKNEPKKYLVATLFFSEEMDEETLLDKKNYTFSNYTVKGSDKGSVRADAAEVSLSVEDGGKTLIIEATNVDVDEFRNIALVGLKDKAGNNLVQPAAGHVTPHGANAQKVTEVSLIEGTEEEGLLVKVVVQDNIPSFPTTGVLKLVRKTANTDVSDLTLVRSENDNTFYFTIDDKDSVGTDAKAITAPNEVVKIKVISASNEAKSILNDSLAIGAGGKEDAVDKVNPAIDTKAASTTKGIAYDAAAMEYTIHFTEDLAAAPHQVVRLKNSNGDLVAGTVAVAGKTITFTALEGQVNGDYTFELEKVTDKATEANSVNLGSVNYKLAEPTAMLKEIKTVTDSSKDIVIELEKASTKVDFAKKADGNKYTEDDVKADFVVKVAGKSDSDYVVEHVVVGTAGEITIKVKTALVTGDKVTVEYKSTGKLVDEVNTDVTVPSKALAEKTV